MPTRPRGKCRECGQGLVLRLDGNIRRHNDPELVIVICRGSDRPPRGTDEGLLCAVPGCGHIEKASDADPDAAVEEMGAHMRRHYPALRPDQLGPAPKITPLPKEES
ncbi:hypothetical protein [Nocardiopsis synnemataformans]|uniref:hypothetical protein n=1 Tax=Nocardiopsis synnemataformans TaxID=61305 RepID=UPI003EBEC17F